MTDLNTPSTEQASRLQDVSVVQLRLEAQFSLYRIASKMARYYHIASVLPPDVASKLSNALSNPLGHYAISAP